MAFHVLAPVDETQIYGSLSVQYIIATAPDFSSLPPNSVVEQDVDGGNGTTRIFDNRGVGESSTSEDILSSEDSN